VAIVTLIRFSVHVPRPRDVDDLNQWKTEPKAPALAHFQPTTGSPCARHNLTETDD
jgi:hypothetical protein